MGKFSGSQKSAATGPLKTTGKKVATHEGGVGFKKDAKTDLFLLAATNLVGESAYYESAGDRDARFRDLVRAVTKSDPAWVQAFIPYMRNTLNMRSASVVAAAEYVQADGPNKRRVIDSALVRPDEPAELIGYWLNFYGRKLPMAVKRGVADAVVRLYNEYAALKWDSKNNAVRMADVINLVHPKPKAEWQSDLFKHLLNERHNPGTANTPESLAVINGIQEWVNLGSPLDRIPEGITWERLSTYKTMDKAAWNAVIPKMGYMALLRNLRNFDNAGVSDIVANGIANRLSDPEQVARSRQFPYRFLSAYKAVESVRWHTAIDAALDASVNNVPELDGKTLVLVDVSGSMGPSVSQHSQVARWEVGALFGAVTAKRSNADLAVFASSHQQVTFGKGASVLQIIDKVRSLVGRIGYGTEAYGALSKYFDGHDRVLVFTDMQVFPDHRRDALIKSIPNLYVFDLAGYTESMIDVTSGHHLLGGFTDQTFKLIPLLESVGHAEWPWEN